MKKFSRIEKKFHSTSLSLDIHFIAGRSDTLAIISGADTDTSDTLTGKREVPLYYSDALLMEMLVEGTLEQVVEASVKEWLSTIGLI